MIKQYLPYYISRALLSAVFALLVVGFNWKAIPIMIVLFGFFLLYLHSGWFRVDPEKSFFPLRRDTRAQLIQRKALIIAVIAGLVTYFGLLLLSSYFGLTLLAGNIALAAAVLAYFISQFGLLPRT